MGAIKNRLSEMSQVGSAKRSEASGKTNRDQQNRPERNFWWGWGNDAHRAMSPRGMWGMLPQEIFEIYNALRLLLVASVDPKRLEISY